MNRAEIEQSWRVPLVDPRSTYSSLEGELETAFRRVMRGGRYILGPEVEAFEQNAVQWIETSHGVAMSSGTDALLCSLLALDVGPNDEVITSPFTFVSTGEVIMRVGAKPVFADVCPQCLCLDPACVSEAWGPRTKAVIAVHLYGDLGHIHELQAMTRNRGIHLIEDACQAFGSRLGSNKAGTFGDTGCFSFFPTKTLGGFGDAGLVCTHNGDLANRLRSIRSHGRSGKHLFSTLGGNFRMDSLHAALLNVLLREADGWIASRAHVAHKYTSALGDLGELATPQSCSQVNSAWNAYTIRVPGHRDALAAHLKAAGIEVGLYYPLTLADQMTFASHARLASNLNQARSAAREVLSLPIYPRLAHADQDLVIQCIRRYFSGIHHVSSFA